MQRVQVRVFKIPNVFIKLSCLFVAEFINEGIITARAAVYKVLSLCGKALKYQDEDIYRNVKSLHRLNIQVILGCIRNPYSINSSRVFSQTIVCMPEKRQW